MAFKAGRIAAITFNSQSLGVFIDTLETNIKVDTYDTTTFSAAASVAWKTAIAGLVGETVTFSGGYDPTVTTGPASAITLSLGTIVPVIIFPAGNNAGQGTSHTFNAIVTDYKESSKTSDKVNFDCSLLVTAADTIAQL